MYIDYVAKKVCTLDEIGRELYNSILDFDCKEHGYWSIYSERKRLILSFGVLTKESIEFCARVDIKETEAIYYLTDLTENEKSLIIANLARYYIDYSKEQIIEILTNLRPEFDFTEDVDFIEEGMIDSLDVVNLVAELELTYNINIDGLDVVPENFSTIDNIMKLLSKNGVK